MNDISPIVGKNLKKIRTKRGLSLDETSKLTKVSKAMLGQIERGDSNPTISTLWKISTGLKLSFSSFIEDSEEKFNIISQDSISPLEEDDGRMKLYPIFPFDINKGFEIFTIELKPKCNHFSTAHNEGVEEYIIVTEGTLNLTLNNNIFNMEKGSSIKFKGDIPHSYKNLSSQKVIFQNIIIYNK